MPTLPSDKTLKKLGYKKRMVNNRSTYVKVKKINLKRGIKKK
jgi:hypothetical protein